MRPMTVCRVWLAGLLLGLAAGVSVAAPVSAPENPPIFTDPAEEQRYQRLIAELRCLVCQNQSLADSNAELAQDLRREVQRLMASGADDEQIIAFLTARYGEFVLYRPPLRPATLLLWFGPALLLATGGLVAWRVARRRAAPAALSAAEQERARELLAGDGREGRG